MERNKIQVSIIIVSYNSPHYLEQCIDSIKYFTKDVNYEIIVVDNNSKENNVRMIKTRFPNVILIENPENYGFGKANNQGVKQANGKYIALINSDVELIADTLTKLSKIIEEETNIKCIGIQLINDDWSLQKSFFKYPSLLGRFLILTGLNKLLKPNSFLQKLYTDYSNSQQLIKVDAISGAFMFLKREIFEKVGGFDENYFMYHEEIDLFYRINQGIHKTYCYLNEKVIHKGKHLETPLNEFVFYHRNRSILYFFYKHYNRISIILLIIINLFAFSIKYLLSLLFNQKYARSYLNVIKLNIDYFGSLILNSSKKYRLKK